LEAAERNGTVVLCGYEEVGREFRWGRCDSWGSATTDWSAFQWMRGLYRARSVEGSRRASFGSFSLVDPTSWRGETRWSGDLTLETYTRLIMEENVEMIKACSELVRENLELAIVRYHGKDVFFKELEPFSCVPDYAAIQVDGLGVACSV